MVFKHENKQSVKGVQSVPVDKLQRGEKKHKIVKIKGVYVKKPVPVTSKDIWGSEKQKR